MPALSWVQHFQDSFKKIDDLLSYLELSRMDIPFIDDSNEFLFKVPRSFAERMEKNNPNDPLLLQVLPVLAERIEKPGFVFDPLQEKEANPLPGLLHKYDNRVLVTLSGACAIHCRYCFRRHFSYKDNNPGMKGWERIFDYLSHHSEVKEVILSGGDPLSVDDDLLNTFIQGLDRVSSVNYLRIHTRLPIVIPSRITPSLIEILSKSRFHVTLVLHSNHGNEWNALELKLAMESLRKAGIILFNQAVLLKNINHSLESQMNLSYQLFNHGVIPYYLHLLDKVSGVGHFDLSHEEAIDLMRKMISHLPGYLVPKLVREVAGMKSKVPVDLGLL